MTLLVTAMLAACGAASEPAATTSEPTTMPSPVPEATPKPRGDVATVDVLDADVDHRPSTETDYATAVDGAAIGVGDMLRTDASGFAELAWVDGSLTRLDSDTELVVHELVPPGTDATDTQLDAGRAWSRVQRVGQSGVGYRLRTSVAVAAVRGTAFDVDCRTGDCVVTVLEGTVGLEVDGVSQELEVRPFQRVTVTPDGAGVVFPVGAEVLEEPWIARNLALDEERGFAAIAPGDVPGAGTGDAPPGPDLSGTWEITSEFYGGESGTVEISSAGDAWQAVTIEFYASAPEPCWNVGGLLFRDMRPTDDGVYEGSSPWAYSRPGDPCYASAGYYPATWTVVSDDLLEWTSTATSASDRGELRRQG